MPTYKYPVALSPGQRKELKAPWIGSHARKEATPHRDGWFAFSPSVIEHRAVFPQLIEMGGVNMIFPSVIYDICSKRIAADNNSVHLTTPCVRWVWVKFLLYRLLTAAN